MGHFGIILRHWLDSHWSTECIRSSERSGNPLGAILRGAVRMKCQRCIYALEGPTGAVKSPTVYMQRSASHTASTMSAQNIKKTLREFYPKHEFTVPAITRLILDLHSSRSERAASVLTGLIFVNRVSPTAEGARRPFVIRRISGGPWKPLLHRSS